MKFNLNYEVLRNPSKKDIVIFGIGLALTVHNVYTKSKETERIKKLIKKVEIMTQNGKEVEDL